jgi:hypothetical protein
MWDAGPEAGAEGIETTGNITTDIHVTSQQTFTLSLLETLLKPKNIRVCYAGLHYCCLPLTTVMPTSLT